MSHRGVEYSSGLHKHWDVDPECSALELSLAALDIGDDAGGSGAPSSSNPHSFCWTGILFYFCWWWWRWDGYVLGFSSCFILAHIALYIKADFGCIALYIKADFGCIASPIKVDFEIWMHRLIFFFQGEKQHFLFQIRMKNTLFICTWQFMKALKIFRDISEFSKITVQKIPDHHTILKQLFKFSIPK